MKEEPEKMKLEEPIAERAAMVAQVIAKRRSTRVFEDTPIPQEWLDTIVEAGIAAPSGSNSQNQRFLVVTDPDEVRRIGESRFVWPYRNANVSRVRGTHPGGILGNGTALVLVFADSALTEGRNMGEYYIWESIQIQNCSGAIENMLIQATAMGLASCWVSASDGMNYTRMLSGKSWRRVLAPYDIKPTYKMQGIVLLGFPKRVDELGFAIGEKQHGATAWRTTERKELAEYLVGKRQDDNAPDPLGMLDRWRLRFFSKSIKVALRILKILDRQIWKIELRDAQSVQQIYVPPGQKDGAENSQRKNDSNG